MSTNRLTKELQQLHQEVTSALSGSGEQILDLVTSTTRGAIEAT